MQRDQPEKRSILIVEDDAQLQGAVSEVLEHQGYPVLWARDGHEGIQRLEQDGVWLVLADINLPGKDGIHMLRDIRMSGNEVPVVMMTAYGSINSAVEALKLGATEYLQKPFRLQDLEELVIRIRKDLAGQLRDYTQPHDIGKESLGYLTRSERIIQTLKMLEAVASSQATILIQGESGTGKEVLARHVHGMSSRASQPFIAVNCAALPDGLLESELFGHEKGAFTGALARRCGKFELAHQGTLLLDEIGEMSLGMQAKLLRVLQEREIDRLGGRHPIPVDIRVIATTNRQLIQEVQAGQFREDLYYRLSVVPVQLPPLRDRPEDVPLLAEHFAEQSFRRNHRVGGGMTEEALNYLKARPWRGNIRELENVIERAVLFAGSGPLKIDHVFMEEPVLSPQISPLPSGSLWEMEKDLILRTLERQGGNRTYAARTLGISIRTLRNKLREYRHLSGGVPVVC